jgi:hypothetical protein
VYVWGAAARKNAVLFLAGYTSPKPMNRWSLRAAYVGATVAIVLAAASGEPAHAHLDVRPGVVRSGEAVDLLVELPRLRAGALPVGLELEAEGLEVESTRLVDAVRGDTLWTARVRVDSEAGTLPLVLRAIFADGRSVEVDHPLVVLPGPREEDAFPWVGVLVGIAAAAALTAAALLFLARRRA